MFFNPIGPSYLIATPEGAAEAAEAARDKRCRRALSGGLLAVVVEAVQGVQQRGQGIGSLSC
jgi:hypothetical protein